MLRGPDEGLPSPRGGKMKMKTKRFGLTGSVAMVLAIALASGACASSGGSTGSSSGAITGEQLMATNQSNLYQALQSIRPQWLRSRGSASVSAPTQVMLFVNEAPYGTVNDLSSIPIDAVMDIRFLNASEAGARYGTAAGAGGLLLVRTRS
jgi:hypothetical protein